MDKVYQVFVSSTFSDLQDERQKVTDTLAKAGFISAGMELFPATDQKQLEFIQRTIDRSDYYVVIVAGRYGTLADGKKSYTEKEYEYALQKGLAVLAFLHRCPEEIAVGRTEQDPKHKGRLEAFRNRLKASRVVAFWSTPDELSTAVLTAITQATNLMPAVGWVRGDQAIDPKVLQEAERLRLENEELRRKVEELNAADVRFPPNLPGPDEERNFTIHVKHYSGDTWNKQLDGEAKETVSRAIGVLFVSIYDSLLSAPSDREVSQLIARSLFRKQSGNDTEISLPIREVKSLRFQLEALGLVQSTGAVATYGGGIKDRYVCWNVTEKGRRYASQIRAVAGF